VSTPATQLDLDHGRTAELTSDGSTQTLEVRSEGGTVELRIRITEDGPVLVMEGARVQIQATESIEMQCKTFSVAASESLDLGSEGTLDVHSSGELKVTTEEDCRVVGKMIWLN